MEPSATAYDDSFRTLLNDCRELIIPVVNEAFGEGYTGREKVIFAPNEHFLNQDGGKEEKRITDSSFIIARSDGSKKRYHLECETNLDASVLIRIFEYDAQIALNDGMTGEHTFIVSFPHSAVLALRYTMKTPDTMRIRVITPGGETGYDVPVIKVQQYSLEKILQRKLLFFLPFYIFRHEKHFAEYEDDEISLKKLTDEYRQIRTRLDCLLDAGEINAFTKNVICTMTNHVLALLAKNYQKVKEGVGHIMGGKILEYEAKSIRNEALNEAHQAALAETEERARDMLRDQMELSLVEKYTHLSMPRIQELARGLGML